MPLRSHVTFFFATLATRSVRNVAATATILTQNDTSSSSTSRAWYKIKILGVTQKQNLRRILMKIYDFVANFEFFFNLWRQKRQILALLPALSPSIHYPARADLMTFVGDKNYWKCLTKWKFKKTLFQALKPVQNVCFKCLLFKLYAKFEHFDVTFKCFIEPNEENRKLGWFSSTISQSSMIPYSGSEKYG